ncbi:hypothetical protein B0H17DRAFT_1132717 [Mycena rosella]|uniref:Uncharacterized protein n=1 Tax=Mycena rosella TaxID=1033263 RepID=A0AAD7DJ73_MYCRO|nr:hypothetical protein B0H17DRAFT_1132717 [Mycena rosella]
MKAQGTSASIIATDHASPSSTGINEKRKRKRGKPRPHHSAVVRPSAHQPKLAKLVTLAYFRTSGSDADACADAPTAVKDLQLNSGCESLSPIDYNLERFPTITCGPALHLRGGCGSDESSSEEDVSPDQSYRPAFRIRGGATTEDNIVFRAQRRSSETSKEGQWTVRKRVSMSKNKGKDKAHESDPEPEDLFARANISTLKFLVGGVQFYGSSHTYDKNKPGFLLDINRSLAWSREIQDRYIHGLATMSDGTHVIITINPELARLTLEAIWIMVDTMFTDENARVKVRVNSVDKRQPDQLHKTSTPRGNFIARFKTKRRNRNTAERGNLLAAPVANFIDVNLLSDSLVNSLELFPGSNLRSPLAGPMSDQAALNSDVMSPIFQNIIKDHPMYPINGDGEVWATDLYEQMILS